MKTIKLILCKTRRSYRSKNIILVLLLIYSQCITSYALPDLRPTEINQLGNSSRDPQQGSIFVYGDPAMDNLIPVRVVGAVAKAGIHYIPKDTDLLTLITLAGGTTKEAKLNGIRIKREKTNQVLDVDLEQFVKQGDLRTPLLQMDDIVFVPESKPIISDDTFKVVGLAASLLAIVSTVALISRR